MTHRLIVAVGWMPDPQYNTFSTNDRTWPTETPQARTRSFCAADLTRGDFDLDRPQAFPGTRRLAGRKAFARVFGGRHSAGNRHLVIYAMPNELAYARLGLTVGRRLGNAVRRNRLKRILREAFRLESTKLPAGYDLVCVPRVGVDLSLEDARKSLVSVAARAVQRVRASHRA